MYKFVLADGTELNNICRLNPSTFEIESNNSQMYWALSQDNLAFATLYKDEELEDIFIDCLRTSYSIQNGIVHFRITPLSEVK